MIQEQLLLFLCLFFKHWCFRRQSVVLFHWEKNANLNKTQLHFYGLFLYSITKPEMSHFKLPLLVLVSTPMHRKMPDLA